MDSSQDKTCQPPNANCRKRVLTARVRAPDLSHLAILGTGALMMLMGAEP